MTVPHAGLTRAARRRWTAICAGLGLAGGLAAGAYFHSRQPAEFESTARVQVTGPADAGDAAAQVSILRSQPVLDRAGRGLDEFRPFEAPPPKAEPARVAFLEHGLSATGSSSGNGSILDLAFRGPHPADTSKYLQAVVAAYRSELASRPAPTPAAPTPAPTPTPKPKSPPATSGPTDEVAKIEAEQKQLTRELAALTTDDVPAIEARLTADREAAKQLRARLDGVDRDLALIRNTGPTQADRLATTKQLGLEPDRPAPPPPPPSADLKAAEERLRTLQQRKTELGERLGPEHRDMLALDEQIKHAKEQIAKETPKAAPAQGPDALERHRVKLEADRLALVARSAALAATTTRDEHLLGEVGRIHKRQQELAAARNAHEARPQAKAPEPEAAPAAQAPVAVAYAVQVLTPPAEGARVSTPAYRAVVPGGLLGLLGGGLFGYLASLVAARAADWAGRSRPRVRVETRSLQTVRSSRAPVEPAPRLGVPVFTQVPPIRTDLPPEKKSAEGLSPLLVSFTRPSGPEAEAFRTARRELAAALRNRGHQVIPVTSSGPGDGKTVVAANLAISLAQSGKRVILVDCDFRTAKVQELFRITRLGDSLKSVMAADVDLRMAVRSCEVGNLFLLPAGRGPADPVDLLTRPKFRELLAELRGSYEFVIIDAPPTAARQELAAVASPADGTVLVVRPGADAVSRSDRACGEVIEAGGRVIGAVVNAAPASSAPEQTVAVPPPEPAVPVASGAV